MANEVYMYGSALGIVLSLIGVIWHQLQAKIDKGDATIISVLDEHKKDFKDSMKTMEQNISNRVNEKQSDHSARLTNGSQRMDSLQKQVADIRVDLAQNYHTTAETRQLITDLVSPVHDQLKEIRRLVERLPQRRRSDDDDER